MMHESHYQNLSQQNVIPQNLHTHGHHAYQEQQPKLEAEHQIYRSIAIPQQGSKYELSKWTRSHRSKIGEQQWERARSLNRSRIDQRFSRFWSNPHNTINHCSHHSADNAAHYYDKDHYHDNARYYDDVYYYNQREHLFKLSLDDISGQPLQMLHLPAPQESIQNCTAFGGGKLGKDVDCRNHIREVLPIRDGSTLYVCGTNSRSPTDWQVRASDLTLVPAAERVFITGSNETGKAEGRCSYFVSDNNPSLWLVPNAVAALSTASHAYFVYREDAAERQAYASDWLPDLEGGVLLGAFVTFNHGHPDSAVCAFRLEDIERAFNGSSFYELSFSRSSLSRIVKPSSAAYPGTGSACVSDSRTLPPAGPDFLASHPLLAVPPKERHERPFFALPGVAFSGVTAFVLNEAWGSWIVCYVATATGLVMKIAEEVVAEGQTPVPAELVDAFNTTVEPIRKMLVSKKHRSLYVFSDDDVRQYRIDDCEGRYLECTACVRDPFCGWDATRCRRHVDGCVSFL
ncbi:semaphorin-2A-like [Rhipicephalus microplus]|uniref:semaphorin-2A-like n=1 Tax=Rhipicephalus microplus TaxID=6941 RepID=UPI003F6B04AC